MESQTIIPEERIIEYKYGNPNELKTLSPSLVTMEKSTGSNF